MINKKIDKHIKVCHVTSVHDRYDVRIFHKECKSLVNNGFNVTLLVNDELSKEEIDGVKIISTSLKAKNRYERMIKSKKTIKKLIVKINADIYHFHDPDLLPVANWIKKRGKKVIFDFHEDVEQQILYKEWIPRIFRKIISITYAKYEKKVIKNLDGIISVTPQFIERLKKSNSNSVMVTNYPILKEKNNENNFKRKNAICFAGGISSQWNHENIIKAIEQIDDIEYILVGNGLDKYIEKLKRLKGWGKVKYLGRIPHDKVQNIYNESMIGIALLSHNTQVGIKGTLGNTKLFEFMEAGLPIICSNNKLWEEVVNEYECGKVVNPENVSEITHILKKIINDPKVAQRMGHNGRNAISKSFNWNIEEKKLLKLYVALNKND